MSKKAIYENEHEFKTERIVRQRNGDFRYELVNGGERGAFECRDGKALQWEKVEQITAQQAVNYMRLWGASEEEIAGVSALKEFAAADID